jgi:hypothetical protein
MKHLLKKFGFQRLIVVVIIAISSISMWGCGDWFDEETHFEWAEHRTEKSIVGFIDDSLVITYNARNWYEVKDENDDQVGSGKGNQAIFVYNYRVQLDGPVFMDSLDNGMEENFNYGLGQLGDSVIWGGNVNHLTNDMGNVYSFWKIGQKPYKVKVKENKDGCSVGFNVRKLRTWLDGKIYAQGSKLTRGGDTCQYAILDSVAKNLTYKRFGDDLKWIQKCDDVRAWEKDVYCVILDDESGNSIILKNQFDTIPNSRRFYIGGFWGSMVKMNGNICSLKDEKITCSDVTWRGDGLKFYKDDEVVVDLNL